MCPCPCSFMLLFNFIISFCLFALYVILSVALKPLKRALPAIHLSIIILFQVITNSITPSASAQQITQKGRLCKPRYKYSFYVGKSYLLFGGNKINFLLPKMTLQIRKEENVILKLIIPHKRTGSPNSIIKNRGTAHG